MIRTYFKLTLDNYFLEIYDARFRTYILLDEEYIRNLQDRLPRTSVSTLNGRIRHRDESRNYSSIERKPSFSPKNDHLIIWLDSYIGHPDHCRELKHKFHIITMVDIARPMLDYEYCIDDLIQTDSKSINHLNTFSNKDECLEFLQGVESTMKILFITSNFFGEEIVPLIIKRVQMIYILANDTFFSNEWTDDYRSSLLIFNDNIHLLVRLIRDLAQNFVEKAEMTSKSSVEQAIIFFRWARKLFTRANQIDYPSDLKTLNSIERQLEILELNCNEKDEKFALECDEG